MSLRYMSAVWSLELASSLKYIFVAIADCANNIGECFPSTAFLAKKTGYKKRHVQKCINSLISLKYLQKDSQRRKNGSFTSNKYKILDEIFPAKVVSSSSSGNVHRTPHITVTDPLKENKQKKVKRTYSKFQKKSQPTHISKWFKPQDAQPISEIPDNIKNKIYDIQDEIVHLKTQIGSDALEMPLTKKFPEHIKKILNSKKSMYTAHQLRGKIHEKEQEIEILVFEYTHNLHNSCQIPMQL